MSLRPHATSNHGLVRVPGRFLTRLPPRFGCAVNHRSQPMSRLHPWLPAITRGLHSVTEQTYPENTCSAPRRLVSIVAIAAGQASDRWFLTSAVHSCWLASSAQHRFVARVPSLRCRRSARRLRDGRTSNAIVTLSCAIEPAMGAPASGAPELLATHRFDVVAIAVEASLGATDRWLAGN
jgi:hypothetical protein